MFRRAGWVVSLAIVLLAVGAAVAEERKNSFEISEFFSYNDFAEETSLDGEYGVGLRIGHNFTDWLGGELTYHVSPNAEFESVDRPRVDMKEIQAAAILNWKRKGKKFATRFQPYFVAGLGLADYSPPAGLNDKKAARITRKKGGKGIKYQPSAANVDNVGTIVGGVGTRFYINEAFALRLDLRWVAASSADFINFQPNLGLSFSFGGTGGKDSDGDGVVDYQDDCPETPKGATVDSRGCPSDPDNDGIFSGIDECPDTPEGVVVDAKGCPVDSDDDGVPDGIDECPDTPPGAEIDAKGCPIDSDGDGVFNGIDQCPQTPAGAKVDPKGCPIDSDGDGVPDGIDQCDKTPKGAKVDAKGCPIDSDGDGVPDGIDECPATAEGIKVDKKGCPLVKPLFEEEQKTLILKGVNFDVDKATLADESLMILDEVAASLIAYGQVRVEIQGHTDSTGSERHNQDLSERRAQAVMDYLVSKGVPAERLEAKGYGEGSPVASNRTASGRAENRRVELLRLD
jgi:outer membrane protein OmpA-like peptidoglycan-associated protein